jgi:hypothetical protein
MAGGVMGRTLAAMAYLLLMAVLFGALTGVLVGVARAVAGWLA